MRKKELHTFHIPVMGLGYTIDTPLKIGRFGISSVVSIIEDDLLEQMRKFYCEKENEPYDEIGKSDLDHRAKRITAYLNLLYKILNKQIEKLRSEKFEVETELTKYFEMLPLGSPVKQLYVDMKCAHVNAKEILQNILRDKIIAGAIDVNIMTKLDKTNYTKSGEPLPVEYCDAMAALRGFALSNLNSSIIFSAGINPRLFTYCESFKDFFQDDNGILKKKIILKVSDYRSALVQGKIFAKKGLWISEFRIESGLNCGGHAFATEGLLMGPVLQEFKEKRNELIDELYTICNTALAEKKLKIFSQKPKTKITFQGGIGTADENNFLLDYYSLDGTGWGSPFLLVPEATNVDDKTLHQLATANIQDYYLSHASPLGIPFNNFRKSSSEEQRKMRIKKGRPGSPCYKKYLSSDTEFTVAPICTASREYQNFKIKQIKEKNLSSEVLQTEVENIEEKDCLCEGLGASALLKNHIAPHHKLTAVTICPGPNLAYFSEIFTLQEMVSHIYGRTNILNNLSRPNIFVNELALYVSFLQKEIQNNRHTFSAKQYKYFASFKENLFKGIQYYKDILSDFKPETKFNIDCFSNELSLLEKELEALALPTTASLN